MLGANKLKVDFAAERRVAMSAAFLALANADALNQRLQNLAESGPFSAIEVLTEKPKVSK